MKPDPGTAEPRTEAGRVEADARLRAIANEWAEQARIVFGVDAQQDERGWFSPDAVADLVTEAATEARRELLAALRLAARRLNRHSGKGHGGCVPFVAVMDAINVLESQP